MAPSSLALGKQAPLNRALRHCSLKAPLMANRKSVLWPMRRSPPSGALRRMGARLDQTDFTPSPSFTASTCQGHSRRSFDSNNLIQRERMKR